MCNCRKNGATDLVQLTPVVTGTPVATTQTYYVDLLHYLCGNRKICVSSSYPLSSSLSYTVGTPEYVGNDTYSFPIVVTGSVTYIPYVRNSCGCNPCPMQDFIMTQFSVPVYSATGTPTATVVAGTTQTNPANVEDCCSLTNSCEIETSIVVNSVAPTA